MKTFKQAYKGYLQHQSAQNRLASMAFGGPSNARVSRKNQNLFMGYMSSKTTGLLKYLG